MLNFYIYIFFIASIIHFTTSSVLKYIDIAQRESGVFTMDPRLLENRVQCDVAMA